jgi:hypothetical protein
LLDVSCHDPLAVLPKKLTAPMHTPMINANITAYSTAVAPLSSRQNVQQVFMTALLVPNAPANCLLVRQLAVQPALTQPFFLGLRYWPS